MTATINTLSGRGRLVVDYVGEAAIGAQGSILNPEGVPLLITHAFFYQVTPATLAATLQVGIGALAAASSDIHNALAINAVAGTAWQGKATNDATNAALTTPAVWTAATYLNFTTAAQSALPAVGKMFVDYVRLT